MASSRILGAACARTLAAVSVLALLLSVGLASVSRDASAQVVEPPPAPPVSLRGFTPPDPPNLGDALSGDPQARAKAIAMGKALFFDMQVGSDGQACASCHFHAGADSRWKNQLSPGLNAGDNTFAVLPGGGGGPNHALTLADFPFPPTVNDVVSSAGVVLADIVAIVHGQMADNCTTVPDPVFSKDGVNLRRVEPRNTPTIINAMFNRENFWDGRAKADFNGATPLGFRDGSTVLVMQPDGTIAAETIAFPVSSGGSQATGPPGSDFEMSCRNRTAVQIGDKMVNARPLAGQKVHPNDSALGDAATTAVFGAPLRQTAGPNPTGLVGLYADLIRQAFDVQYWGCGDPQGDPACDPGVPEGHMAANFMLFFGLSVQLWEALLVSDATPFDDFMDGGGVNPVPGFGPREIAGLDVFLNQGKCINCHNTPVFTAVSILSALPLPGQEVELNDVERMCMAPGDNLNATNANDRCLQPNPTPALYDLGFYNIGVRPTAEDILRGAEIPAGMPLSFARQFVMQLLGLPTPDNFMADPCFFFQPFQPGEFDNPFTGPNVLPIDCNGDGFADTVVPTDPADINALPVAVDGAAKVPGLRNVWLTGPFFHNGGHATLEQVVQFYNRGSDFPNNPELDPGITPLGLTQQQIEDLVLFMKALTDPRVLWEMGPFDHPQLFVSHGHVEDPVTGAVVPDPADPQRGLDDMAEIPAVGAGGRLALNPPLPALQGFLERNPDMNHDGVVDAADLAFICDARGTLTDVLNDPRDQTQDGLISNADALAIGMNCFPSGSGRRCGLGFEIALLLPPILWLRGRRRRSAAA